MPHDAKDALVGYLKKRAFDPVLNAHADGRPEAEKRRLEDVQRRTREEVERFERYGSAHEVYVNFKRDLDSTPAKRVHADLKSLGLPTINDIAGDFENEARKLGVAH